MEKDRTYYHCCVSGIIFLDKERTIPLIDLKQLTGETHIPGRYFRDYSITSSISDKYMEAYMRQQTPELYESNAVGK